MSAIEQELVLFFKLYLLARHDNYVNYMENAEKLASWFSFEVAINIILDNAPIYCGSCFEEKGSCFGGTFTISCKSCNNKTNMAYEIQQLAQITKTNWNTCIYLMCRAVEDIYKCNNVKAFQGPLG